MGGTERMRAFARAVVAVAIVAGAAVPVGARAAGAADPVAQPSISVPDIVVGESEGTVTIPVTLHAPGISTVTVQYATASGGAASGSDFTSTNGLLTFNPGETVKNVVVQLADGTVPESYETFTLGLFNATSSVISKATAQIGIVDNDTLSATPALYARDVTVDESVGNATVVVMLGGPAGRASTTTVTASYTTGNLEAAAGSDYTTTSGTLTFLAGQTVKRITVPVTNDTSAEATERFRLTLSAPTGGATLGDANAVVTIPANDRTAVAQPSISIPDLIVGEVDGHLDVPVTLNTPGLNQVVVQYSTTVGSAASNSDYRTITGTLRFDPGETTRVLRIPLVDNTTPEGFETFTLRIFGPTSAFLGQATAQLSIADDDNTVATPALVVKDVIVDESERFATVPVIVGGTSTAQASGAPITVSYATSNLEATAGTDFTATSGTLRFNPGQTVKHVMVPITNDATTEGGERLRVTLSAPSGATLGDGTATVTIGASDAPSVAQPAISAADLITREGDGYVDVPVVLNAPGLLPVTVQYSTTGQTASSASDFRSVTGTARFEPGQTTRVVRLEIIDGNVATEAVELFRLNFVTPTNAVIAKPATRINVIDNDVAGFSAGYTTAYSNAELPRLLQTATYMEMTVEELQKAGIGLFAFVFALSNPRPAPEVAVPPALDGPNTFTTHWTSTDIGLLWDVQAQYALTPEQAQKFGVNFITFLLILGGN